MAPFLTLTLLKKRKRNLSDFVRFDYKNQMIMIDWNQWIDRLIHSLICLIGLTYRWVLTTCLFCVCTVSGLYRVWGLRAGSGERPWFEAAGVQSKGRWRERGRGGSGSGREAGGTASGQRRAGKCNSSSTMVTTECMNNTAIPLLTLTTEI